jgi:nucleotide-binding universal stress UspA family protein
VLDRVLIPLDGSACADHAFAYGLALAKAEGACIEVYASVDPRAILGRDLPNPLEEEHTAAAMSEAQRVVAAAVARARKARIHARGHADFGEPATGIVERASEVRADTIVMGTHGRSGFKRLFMGSVAERVLRSAPCPVVVIRERAVFKPEARPQTIADGDGAVWMLRLVQVAPEDFERLYGEIATFLDGPGGELPGVLETELLGSTDRRRIEILAKFRSHGDWVRAQWDERLGDLLEEISITAQTLEFNLYRGDRFSSHTPEPVRAIASPDAEVKAIRTS